jgi:hypothetical protein
VRTPAIVVRDPLPEDSAEVTLVERHHPVQAFAPNRANHAFAEARCQCPLARPMAITRTRLADSHGRRRPQCVLQFFLNNRINQQPRPCTVRLLN